MARKSLRPQLNQIRSWVREGRTDAWIAHQLDIPASELREFRRRHGLTAEGTEEAEPDLRDEIEAEIEAATLDEAGEEEAPEEEAPEEEAPEEEAAAEEAAEEEAAEEDAPSEERPRRRRRRRRRRGGRRTTSLQGTFDHGDTDGYGLWLDPAIQDDAVYSEHWAGHRAVEVEVEPDRIVIRRSE